MTGKKRPVYRRVIAAAIAILLLGFMAFVTNSFIGNPVSSYFAKRQMKMYIENKYPDMGLVLSKTEYNFKYAGYTLRASKPDSLDTHFMVIRRSDGTIHDDYENYVLSGFNTMVRLGSEMTEEIAPLLKESFGSELVGRCNADLFGRNKDLSKAPPLDTPFNRDMELNAVIYLDFDIKEPSLEDTANKIQKANELLKKEGFSVGGYIVEALNRETKKGYMINVDVALIDENLANTMEKALDSKTYDERISVSSMK